MPALMKHSMYTLGRCFYDWVYVDERMDERIKDTPSADIVLTYALLAKDCCELKFVLRKVKLEPPMLSTGQENRAMATPTNPNV